MGNKIPGWTPPNYTSAEEDYLIYPNHTKRPYRMKYMDYHFKKFSNLYQVKYESEAARNFRYRALKDNMILVNEYNERYLGRNLVFDINSLADLHMHELLKYCTGFNMTLGYYDDYSRQSRYYKQGRLDAMDWSAPGYDYVLKPRNQRDCAVGYVLSAVANIESQYGIATRRTPPEMSLAFAYYCDRKGHCDGGGAPHWVMLEMSFWKAQHHGQAYEQFNRYKLIYRGRKYECSTRSFNITFYEPIHYRAILVFNLARDPPEEREHILSDMVSNLGPVVTAIRTPRYLFFYKSGILLEDPVNESDPLMQNVLVVGYGIEGSVPYWKLLCSYGENWGEMGYMRTFRGAGHFGIGMYVSTVQIYTTREAFNEFYEDWEYN